MRDLKVGRAALLVAGVGTVLAAGAGLASAAETLPAVPDADATSVDGAKTAAPNLSVDDNAAETAGKSQDIGTVNGEDLAGLSHTSDQFSGLGSGS